MAANKSTKSKSAGKQKIQAGPSGKMQKFSGAGPQAPSGSAVTKHSGKGASFAKGGPGGKMQKFSPVKAVKPA